MKGDFSFAGFDPALNYTSVRHQQGRVLLDRDWNDAQAIEQHWRTSVAADAFGFGVLAVPATQPDSFQVLGAARAPGGVLIELDAGRAWASGVPVSLAARSIMGATYLDPPLAPATDPASIAAGVRDAVVLEAFEDTVSGYQNPAGLIEPALGGLDTTERVQSFATLRLLRLGDNEDCSAVGRLVDDPATRGRLTVAPSPSLVIAGDCPLEAGGGYTGLEHYLYRIEVADPSPAGRARFKWSRFNGGLAGRGVFVATGGATGNVTVTANDQAIDTCGDLADAYLEALVFDAARGTWIVAVTATANRTGPGLLRLTSIAGPGPWPAAADGTAFFRLWDGIGAIGDFAAAPADFVEGMQLAFDAPAPGNTNYRPGDYWNFPVRANGVAFDAPLWPAAAPPQGIVYRRVALGVLRWEADATAMWDRGEIEDCRRIFRPLTNQKICCAFNVGDGRSSFGDFNSIELALRHLPAAGGEICLLPGLHTANAVIDRRANVTIRGCGERTRVLPRESTPGAPIFTVIDSERIEIDHMDLAAFAGTAMHLEATAPGACSDVSITRHRIVAWINAISARDVSGLAIAHNRIRMIDRQDGREAIDLRASDALVERNDIGLIPAEHSPPVDPVDPIDPVDPCVEIRLVYTRPRVLMRYLDRLWTLVRPYPFWLDLAQPYRALGGIRVRGGSEQVRILENRIVGGAGNGITLGTPFQVRIAPAPPPAPPQVRLVKGGLDGDVVLTDGSPAAGVQVIFRSVVDPQDGFTRVSGSDGTIHSGANAGLFHVAIGAPGLEIVSMQVQYPDANHNVFRLVLQAAPQPDRNEGGGFIYGVAIERNAIAAMGLSGIGVPPATPPGHVSAIERARALLGTPVMDLAIRDNRIERNLRNPFGIELGAQAGVRGLGGISLGFCDDLAITGNRVEANGLSGTDPACGVFVGYGEAVEISRNVILDNGTAPGNNAAIRPGIRGGIVVGLAAGLGLLAALRGKDTRAAASSAVRVLANRVEQPVGCALRLRAFGPVMVNDNVLANERAAREGLDGIAGTVLISNLAGVQSAGPGIAMRARFAAGAAAAAEPAAMTQPVADLVMAPNAGASARLDLQRSDDSRGLPFGPLMFNDNQVRGGAGLGTPLVQLLVGYDDVSVASNQCISEQAGPLSANTAVFGATLRVTANRLRERSARGVLSLFTVSSAANDTTLNQGDHCIVAVNSGPLPTVQFGNQVLFPSGRCARYRATATVLFQPLKE